jgi:hypothetical protein
VVQALLNSDKSLHAVDSAKYAVNPLVALGWNAGILRVAGHANLVLVGDRDDAVEEVGDPLPEGVCINASGSGKRRGRMRFGELPYTVNLVPASGPRSITKHAENAHVVLDGRQASPRAITDKGLDALDVAVPLGALRQHDRGVFLTVDVAGFENLWTDTDDFDVVLFGEIAHPVQLLDCGEDTSGIAMNINLWIPANMTDTVTRKVLEVLVGGWGALATEFHEQLPGFDFRRSRR